MSPQEMREICLALPGVEEGFNMGSVVFKVGGKVLARLLEGDQAMFVGIDFDEREVLLEARPQTFHITPHYKDYRGVIVRLGAMEPAECRSFMEKRWRQIAPGKMIKVFDAGPA